jgi:hypothetical protein
MAAGRSSWVAVGAGANVPQADHRGDYGLALQAGAGTWLYDFLGIEGGVGYSRIAGETEAVFPALFTYAGTTYATVAPFDVRESVTTVPIEATLKLALPNERIRPYLLGGAGLEFIRVERALLVGASPYGSGYEAAADRIGSTDVALGLHAGLGVWIPVAPRLRAVAEARYHWARTQLRYHDQKMGPSIDLNGMQLTAGVAYTF